MNSLATEGVQLLNGVLEVRLQEAVFRIVDCWPRTLCTTIILTPPHVCTRPAKAFEVMFLNVLTCAIVF